MEVDSPSNQGKNRLSVERHDIAVGGMVLSFSYSAYGFAALRLFQPPQMDWLHLTIRFKWDPTT
jgi:hypothetical protein